MTIRVEHPLHRRRLGRNLGLGGALVAFVVIIFSLTIVKISADMPMQAFDHVVRPEMVPQPQTTSQPKP